MAFLSTRGVRSALGAWVVLLSLGGCDYLTFDVSEDQASVLVVEPSAAFETSGFGRVLAGYAFEDDSGLQGRFAVGAGAGSPLAVYALWRGSTLGSLDKPLFEVCEADAPVACGGEAGAALAGMPAWVGASGTLQSGCVLSSSPADGDHVVVCENNWSEYQGIAVAPGVRAGESAAPLPPSARMDLGVALLGAPEQGPRGNLLLLPGAASERGQLLWGDTEVPVGEDGARLGAAVAVRAASDGRVLFAAGAPGAQRVLVGELLSSAAGTEVVLLGCLGPEEEAPGFGGVLALMDPRGDGSLDLVASTAAEVPGRLQRVWRWQLAGLSGGAGCGSGLPAAPPPDQVVSCDTLQTADGVPDLLCEGALFGAALTPADLNGDGAQELLVGAPGASVNGASGAGMVVALGAERGALRTEAVQILYDAAPEADAALGAALAAVPVALGDGRREEAVAGAPGANRVFVFLCSGLPGDSPRAEDGTDRCLEP